LEETIETRNDNDFHSLPPEPVEELKSNNRSSQTPNSLGIEIVTEGSRISSGEGPEIVTLLDLLEGQSEQSDFEVHWARNRPPFNSKMSPTLNREAGVISIDWSVIQTQRLPLTEIELDEEDWEAENNFEQSLMMLYFNDPPSSVAPEKSIKILPPSEENIAFFNTGAGVGSWEAFTINSDPEGKETS
jgi:hypothetical protein